MSSTKVVTPEARVSFVNVFKPNDKDKYSMAMLFPPEADLSALKKAAAAAVEAQWGNKPPKNLRSPFRPQSEKADQYEGYLDDDDAMFINVSTKNKPGLVDASNHDIFEEEEFFSGCYARASLNAFAYDVDGNRGVSFGLNNIQRTRPADLDDRLGGGRSKPQNDFEVIEEAEDAGDLF